MTGLLTEGPVKRRLALFTLPILVSNILQQLYSAADAVIVGRVAGGKSLAAVGASTPIITLFSCTDDRPWGRNRDHPGQKDR